MPIKRHSEAEFEQAVARDKAREPRTALESIGRLPETIRDEISRAILDRKTWRYVAKICERAGLKGVKAQNVTNYKQSRTHLAWLAKEERKAAIRADQAEGREIYEAALADGMNPAEAACLVASRKMLTTMKGIDLSVIDDAAQLNPKLYIEFIRATTALAKVLKPGRQSKAEREAAAQDAPKGGGLSAKGLEEMELKAKLL